MKLNRKFSFIILFTIVQSCVLTVFSIINVKRIQSIKDYLNMETRTEAQLGTIIDYLEKMDYWDFDITKAYTDFEKQKKEISESFKYLTEAQVLKMFPEEFTSNLKQTNLTWELLNESFAPVEEIFKTMEQKEYNAGMRSNIQNYGIRETAKLYANNEDAQQLLSYTEEAHQQLRKIRLLNVQLMTLNKKSSVMINEVMQQVESRFVLIAIIFAVITTIILSVLILIVTTRVARRIIKVRNVTSTLSEKDFSVNIEPEGSDEMRLLMSNINNMVNQINNFFCLVKSTAKKALVSEASINESAGRTAEATTLIDQNIESINKVFSEAVGLINSAIGVIAEMNLHVDTLVRSNSVQTSAIENSNAAVNEVVSTLDYINKMAVERVKNAEEMHTYVADGDDKITATNEILGRVSQQLDEVYEVVTIINNVAEQTNLLSMNAAIESAHAGEAGKGFGVVAEEIRSLAEETAENADKISKVVNTIVEAVENANKSSQSAFEAFEKVSSHADQIVNSLQEITGGVGKIDAQMLQIKQRSEETSSAADEMNRYCGELADRQKQVSLKVDNMNDVFVTAMSSLHKIKEETADIVHKMKSVSSSSDESYKNLTELENVLEEFKTSVIEGVETEISEKAEEAGVAREAPAEQADTIDDVCEIGEEGLLDENGQVVSPQEDKSYKSPSLAEIEEKLNELAMTGGFGISLEDSATSKESEAGTPDKEVKSEETTEEPENNSAD